MAQQTPRYDVIVPGVALGPHPGGWQAQVMFGLTVIHSHVGCSHHRLATRQEQGGQVGGVKALSAA